MAPMISLSRDPTPVVPRATGSVGVPPRRSWRTRSVMLVVALLLMLLGLAVAPPAYAATQPVVEVHLDELTPALPARSDTITVRGTARNTSDRPITDAQVVLWRHWSGMTDLTDLNTVMAADPAAVGGVQLWLEEAYQPLDDTGAVWEPGQTREFEVSAQVEAFGFPSASGAFLIGAQVVGRHDGQTLATLGQAQVLLPLGSDQAATTTATNTIVPTVLLSTRPSMIGAGVFRDDHLAEEVSPEGRLSVLLRAAQRDEVSWLIDPSLLDEMEALAAGYVVRTPHGEQEGTGSEDAAAWLTAFADLDRDRGYRVPYAIPDVNMLVRADLTGVMRQATLAAAEVSAVAELPLVAYIAGGMFDAASISLAEMDHPVAILAATPQNQGTLLNPVRTSPIISFNPGITSGRSTSTPSTLQTQQRMLADSYLTALTDPDATSIWLITTAEAADAADAVLAADWLRQGTLSGLLDDPPQQWSGEFVYGETARAAELSGPQREALQEVITSYASFTSMLVDDAAISFADAAAPRAASSWWRGDTHGFDEFIAPQAEAMQRLWSGESVELMAQRSVIMSGQSGSFPMTVTNHLDQPIRVTLTFESFQPQRLSIPPMTDIIVPARQGFTVNVHPHAVGNGPVRISSQVTAPGGTPVSKRVWLTVEATNFGRVGWIIVVASGIVLVATSALRIRQVRRERAMARHAAPDEPPPVVSFQSTRSSTPAEEISGE